MKRLQVIFFIISCALIGSCKGYLVNPPQQKPFNFNMTIGSTWKYAVTDYGVPSDTLVVLIVDSIRLPDNSHAMVWLYKYKFHNERYIVTYTNDTLRFYFDETFQNTYPSCPTLLLIIPFEVGQQWSFDCETIFKISSKDSLTLPAGTFVNSYAIEKYFTIPNSFGGTIFWIDPQVGIVKMQESWFDTITRQGKDRVWKLLTYHIA